MHTQYANENHTDFVYTDIETTVIITILAVLFAIGIAVF